MCRKGDSPLQSPPNKIKRNESGIEKGSEKNNCKGNLLLSTGKSNEPFARSSMTIDEAIERVGYGKFQTLAMWATGLCFMSDSMEVALLSFLSTVLRYEWDLTAAQAATITGSVFAGEIIGTIILGRLGDVFGRRPLFLTAAGIICVSGALTALANDFMSLLFVRFIVGFGVGGLTVPYDIFAEFLPTEKRGRDLMHINYFWTAGSVLVTIFAYVTLGQGYSWRIFVFLCCIPCFTSAVMCYLVVPESPRWLLSQGRNKEAVRVIRDVAVLNKMEGAEVIFSKQLKLKEVEVEESDFSLLFTPKWLKTTLLLWGLWFGFGFSYNGTVLLITRIFAGDEDPSDQISGDSYPDFDYSAISISAMSEFVGVVISLLLIDTNGRISTQVMGYSLAGGAGALMCFSTLLSRTSTTQFWLTLLAFIARTFEMTGSCVSWISTAEVLKTEIRSTGHSAANAICRIGAVLTSYAVESDTPLVVVGTIMALLHVFTAFCASQLPETKGLELGMGASSTKLECEKLLVESKPNNKRSAYEDIL